MKGFVTAAAIALTACSTDPSDTTATSANAAVSDGQEATQTKMDKPTLLFFDRPEVTNYIPPPPGPLARAEGILDLEGNCVVLRMKGDTVPLVFETGTASLPGSAELALASGERIAFGSRVELAGSTVGDEQGTYPISRIEASCGVRRGLLVTNDSLRATLQ